MSNKSYIFSFYLVVKSLDVYLVVIISYRQISNKSFYFYFLFYFFEVYIIQFCIPIFLSEFIIIPMNLFYSFTFINFVFLKSNKYNIIFYFLFSNFNLYHTVLPMNMISLYCLMRWIILANFVSHKSLWSVVSLI
jgi:hypothetical protein